MIGERDPLYDVKLTASEAASYFEGARSTFESVRDNPYGEGLFVPKMRAINGHIAPGAQKQLVECIGVLLPLGQQEVVQEATIQRKEDEITVFDVGSLFAEISFFQANFRNSGVKFVGWTRDID